MDEIEAICVEIETLVGEVKVQLEEEIAECEFSDFYASYVKRLREIMRLIEEILASVSELRTLKGELYEYYQ